MKYKTVAILDTIEDRIMPQSLELINFAETICGGDPSRILLVIPGKDIFEEATSISRTTGIDVAVIKDPGFYYPHSGVLIDSVARIINEVLPSIVCLTHAMRNCAVAGALSVAAGWGCITGVESVELSDCGVICTRSMYNGKLHEKIKPLTGSTVVTVMPGAFQYKENSGPCREGSVTVIEPGFMTPGFKPLALKKDTDNEAKLEEADVIIAAGKGIGGPDNLQLVKDTAKLFDNSAIGASRPVCDNRWLHYRHQVGVTGKTVSPKLYMALGISGSQQHIAGMKNSQCIVAVNSDPHAAIFSVADYIIVEDLFRFLHVFLQKAGIPRPEI